MYNQFLGQPWGQQFIQLFFLAIALWCIILILWHSCKMFLGWILNNPIGAAFVVPGLLVSLYFGAIIHGEIAKYALGSIGTAIIIISILGVVAMFREGAE